MNDPSILGDLVMVFPLILWSPLMSYRNIVCDVIFFFPLSLNPTAMKTMISGTQIPFQNISLIWERPLFPYPF